MPDKIHKYDWFLGCFVPENWTN